MYYTTEVAGKISLNSASIGSSSVDKFILSPSILKVRPKISENNTSTIETVKGLRNCMSTCASLITAFALTFVIVLWVVALVVDGPDEMHNCVLLWPIVTAVLVIAFLFIFLRCTECCLKMRHSRKNKKNVGEPLGMRDSLRNYKSKTETHILSFSPVMSYEKPRCIIMSYAFLVFALFCVMLASVVQYFTLDTNCLDHLQETVSELLLGYEVLAYTSVVVLSMVGCFVTCFCMAIVINCCNNKKHTSEV